MPEYGVWLEDAYGGAAGAAQRGEAPAPQPPGAGHKLAWRGSAASGEEALRTASAAWEERFGTTTDGCLAQVVEIEEDDEGFRGG
ncbi:MAG: hypothetical protein ACLQBB_02940 [Solirubrobacteraceae bacterium]